MKKRILFAGLLLLLTLSTFAATPVTSGKTNAQKIVEAIHNPKTDYVVGKSCLPGFQCDTFRFTDVLGTNC